MDYSFGRLPVSIMPRAITPILERRLVLIVVSFAQHIVSAPNFLFDPFRS